MLDAATLAFEFVDTQIKMLQALKRTDLARDGTCTSMERQPVNRLTKYQGIMRPGPTNSKAFLLVPCPDGPCPGGSGPNPHLTAVLTLSMACFSAFY